MVKMLLIAHLKWKELHVTTPTTAITISEKMRMTCHHGLPEELVSDNGFILVVSAEFKEFLQQNGVNI